MGDLRIAPDLTLPLDTVTQSMAILARRGAGKTYTGSVLVEEVIRAQVPVVVLDPTGAWWGLRSSVDGREAGLPVVIFGGDHADVPLEPTAGTVIADVVLEHPGAYVIDLSAFTSKASEQRFAADFLERLYRGKKRDTGPLLVVVDEADFFAPQQPRDKGDQLRTLGALESIVRRGRIKGLGDLLITQRAAVLNKNVLTQTEILIIMQTTGPQDIAAVKEWITGHASKEEAEEFVRSLPPMEQGEAWVWSPAFLRILQRVKIRARTTFDSSRTPSAGEMVIEPTTFAQVDLDALGERVAATIERQKADDPRELRRQIAELKRELSSKPTEKVEIEKIVEVEREVEVAVLTAAEKELIDRLIEVMRGSTEEVREALARATSPVHKLRRMPFVADSIRITDPTVIEDAPRLRQVGRAILDVKWPNGKPPPTSTEVINGDIKLTPTAKAVLTALAQYPQGRTQAQTALLSGYSSTSGGFFAALALLRKTGYMAGTASLLRITEEGKEALGAWEPLPTGPALLGYWLQRLKPTERGVLSELVQVWPDSLTQVVVAERAGYSSNSGGFFGALAKLRKLDLITGTASALRASDDIAEHR